MRLIEEIRLPAVRPKLSGTAKDNSNDFADEVLPLHGCHLGINSQKYKETVTYLYRISARPD